MSPPGCQVGDARGFGLPRDRGQAGGPQDRHFLCSGIRSVDPQAGILLRLVQASRIAWRRSSGELLAGTRLCTLVLRSPLAVSAEKPSSPNGKGLEVQVPLRWTLDAYEVSPAGRSL